MKHSYPAPGFHTFLYGPVVKAALFLMRSGTATCVKSDRFCLCDTVVYSSVGILLCELRSCILLFKKDV